MSGEVVFYHNPMSRGRMVHWMLEESGAPYRIEAVRFDKGEHKQPKFLAINPMGKIPAIVHQGTTVTECGAIIAYLADAFPAAKLAPAIGERDRGTYLRWMFFTQGCTESALIDRMLARPPVEKTSALGYGTYESVLDTLEKALTPAPYLLGDRFSAADLYLGSQLGFGFMVKFLEQRPVFVSYVNRLQERPAFKRVLEESERLTAELERP
ncbi:MAG TPA: glutathione S-transferase family protein [Steroidobacteraceae bacterium]|nr:glutathione S-transferase family protein [Steroidobacteraceae bacterium]